jgi:hypothetical protein
MSDSLFNDLARYYDTPPTLEDGSSVPLRVNENGAVVIKVVSSDPPEEE